MPSLVEKQEKQTLGKACSYAYLFVDKLVPFFLERYREGTLSISCLYKSFILKGYSSCPLRETFFAPFKNDKSFRIYAKKLYFTYSISSKFTKAQRGNKYSLQCNKTRSYLIFIMSSPKNATKRKRRSRFTYFTNENQYYKS